MAKCRLQAFLLCEKATVSPESDRRVTLHHLFDRIKVPPNPKERDLVFAYYKDVADAPCILSLRVIGPQQREIRGNWRDSIRQAGPIQGVWALDTGLFNQPGVYNLVLQEENDSPDSDVLATTRLAVDVEGK
jgi:hypothetical protein